MVSKYRDVMTICVFYLKFECFGKNAKNYIVYAFDFHAQTFFLSSKM